MPKEPYDRAITFRDLRRVVYDSERLAREAGRYEAGAALDCLMTAVCNEADRDQDHPAPIFRRVVQLARRLGMNLNWMGDPVTTFRRCEPLRHSPAPEPDSALIGLYREWVALKLELNRKTADMESALWEAGYLRLLEIERLIAAASAATLQGFAVKILVADDWGDMSGNDNQLSLVADALTILGEPSA